MSSGYLSSRISDFVRWRGRNAEHDLQYGRPYYMRSEMSRQSASLVFISPTGPDSEPLKFPTGPDSQPLKFLTGPDFQPVENPNRSKSEPVDKSEPVGNIIINGS